MATNQQLDIAMAEALQRLYSHGTDAASDRDIALATAGYLGSKLDAGFDRLVDRIETLIDSVKEQRQPEKTRLEQMKDTSLHIGIPVGAVAIVGDVLVRLFGR